MYRTQVLHRPFVFKKMLHASSMKSREKNRLEDAAAGVPAATPEPTVNENSSTTLNPTLPKEKSNLESCPSEQTTAGTGGGTKDSTDDKEVSSASPGVKDLVGEPETDAIESVVEDSVHKDTNSGNASDDDAPPLPPAGESESALQTSQKPSFHGTSILEQLQAEDAAVRPTSTSSPAVVDEENTPRLDDGREDGPSKSNHDGIDAPVNAGVEKEEDEEEEKQSKSEVRGLVRWVSADKAPCAVLCAIISSYCPCCVVGTLCGIDCDILPCEVGPRIIFRRDTSQCCRCRSKGGGAGAGAGGCSAAS